VFVVQCRFTLQRNCDTLSSAFGLRSRATLVAAGVAIASGLHWYLKYYCNASIAWGKGGSGNQLATVPSANNLPMPTAQRNVSPVRVRYAYNVSRQQTPRAAAG
jgi:hypothetical protein